ncbi:Uncharacterised protein [Candidatus Bilamarchaeum dharawalense]|uniref:Uncharacterized protein n=1 Tax=Candidatus Bilamarchaeum dharawalense TaxID=2885759 RepID=A0A5E4LTL9_9ARCH|nr:Uncharacterised protein [Candidatus Bilamarchaeum dharawalense]
MKMFIFAMLVFAGGLLFFGCLGDNQPGNGTVVGNDSDSHGCKLSAGYNWCDAKQKCIRPWEENCTVMCPDDARVCPDGSAVGRTGPNCTFAPCPDYSNITNFDECAAAGYPILESYPPQCRTPDNRTFVQKINGTLTEVTCTTAGGHWNPCGSACRGALEGTICTLQCVQYCECGGIAGFNCPDSYYCTDYLPENAADAMGICKPISN